MNKNTAGVGFLDLLFLLFLALKLSGVINWSWWWVTSPIWLTWLIILVVIGILKLMK